MESLFNYKSDEENEDDPSKVKNTAGVGSERIEGEVLELDANYDNVTMEMSEDSSLEPTTTCEEGGKEEEVCPLPLLSSSSSTSSLCTSSSSSSSKSETGNRKRKYVKKVDSQKTRKERSPSKKKSFEHENSSANVKNSSRHDEASREKRSSESERYEDRRRDRHREIDSSRGDRKRSPRSPRRGERSHHHHQSRRSRSPIHRRRSSSKQRSHGSSSYKYRERDRESSSKGRSRSRSRGRSSKKPSKLTILGRLGIELKVPEGSMTPQMALQKSMQEQVAKVKDATGITLPSYYNPIAVNPSKYAEQMQKRKLLWGGGTKINNSVSEKKEGENKDKTIPVGPASLWQGATFSQDQDGKLTAKFKRLMGIKNTDEGQQAKATTSITDVQSGVDLIKKQEEMFNSMEMQYEVARVATHTHRGLGLGFGLHQYPR